MPISLVRPSYDTHMVAALTGIAGREQRRSEPFLQSCKQAATQILAVVQPKIMVGATQCNGLGMSPMTGSPLYAVCSVQKEDVPYVIISHSCGNWVAYEFLRLVCTNAIASPATHMEPSRGALLTFCIGYATSGARAGPADAQDVLRLVHGGAHNCRLGQGDDMRPLVS